MKSKSKIRFEINPPDNWNAWWIWNEPVVGRRMTTGKNEACYFRREFSWNSDCRRMVVHLSADSRYKFYINGQLVVYGPLKGDRWRKYFESLDVTGFLLPGKNVLAARVIHFNTAEPWRSGCGGLVSQQRSSTGAFLLEGEIFNGDGVVSSRIVTDNSWKCMRDVSVKHRSGLLYMPNVGETEVVKGTLFPHGWEEIVYDDSSWKPAVCLHRGVSPDKEPTGDIDPWPLVTRSIPLLSDKQKDFAGAVRVLPGNRRLPSPFPGRNHSITFSPHTEHIIELDAGEYTTGYPELMTSGGKGSTVKITYAECYGEPVKGTHQYKKGIRSDAAQELIGEYDIYKCAGFKKEVYEPFWFRVFRYIRLEINVADVPLTLHGFTYRYTGYPLNVESKFHCQREMFNRFWEISVRTLKCCMHETYEDCPYMEQAQYVFDTRQQALFTYQISTDDRLARKALYDFHSSLMPSGLLQARFPSVVPSIIPTFSLYWIWMLYDHYRYFGDLSVVKRFLPTMEAVIGWFERHLDNRPMVEYRGYFPFVDWTQEWWDKKSHGRPPAFKKGPITFDSLLLLYTLREPAVTLFRACGMPGSAVSLEKTADLIEKSVVKHCWSAEKKYFMDGPGVEEYCQHTQVFAVLSGACKGAGARSLLERAFCDRALIKMSYAMSFFIFRAFEKMGIYEKTFPLWERWERQVRLGLTTWVEDEFISRSDCHGWGSVPLYEFPAMILGVQPAKPGYAKININPHPGHLTRAEGRVATCRGPIDISIVRKGEYLQVSGYTHFNEPTTLIFPDGNSQKLCRGAFSYKGRDYCEKNTEKR